MTRDDVRVEAALRALQQEVSKWGDDTAAHNAWDYADAFMQEYDRRERMVDPLGDKWHKAVEMEAVSALLDRLKEWDGVGYYTTDNRSALCRWIAAERSKLK